MCASWLTRLYLNRPCSDVHLCVSLLFDQTLLNVVHPLHVSCWYLNKLCTIVDHHEHFYAWWFPGGKYTTVHLACQGSAPPLMDSDRLTVRGAEPLNALECRTLPFVLQSDWRSVFLLLFFGKSLSDKVASVLATCSQTCASLAQNVHKNGWIDKRG